MFRDRLGEGPTIRKVMAEGNSQLAGLQKASTGFFSIHSFWPLALHDFFLKFLLARFFCGGWGGLFPHTHHHFFGGSSITVGVCLGHPLHSPSHVPTLFAGLHSLSPVYLLNKTPSFMLRKGSRKLKKARLQQLLVKP